MIEQLHRKLNDTTAPQNIVPLSMFLESAEDLRTHAPTALRTGADSNVSFDLALSHLTLHHIDDLSAFLCTIHDCLKPGGWAALTDFENTGVEATLFHPKANSAGVARHGITKDEMVSLMRSCGFEEVRVDFGWALCKEVERWPGEFDTYGPDKNILPATRDFPFLVCMGRRAL